MVPCLYFDEALSIRKALKAKDLKRASELLYELIKNKPEKNKWSIANKSQRAFYQIGG